MFDGGVCRFREGLDLSRKSKAEWTVFLVSLHVRIVNGRPIDTIITVMMQRAQRSELSSQRNGKREKKADCKLNLTDCTVFFFLNRL